MQTTSHFLMGWVVASSAKLSRKERAMVAIGGILPDLDGLGAVVEIFTKNTKNPHLWYYQYHHFLCHNIFFALLVSLLALWLAQKKFKTAVLVFLSFHLHLIFDLLGGKGPDGFLWPIYYFGPLTKAYPLSWSGAWLLNSWPNLLITGLLILATLYIALKKGYSPLEIISPKADQKVVETLRNRFGRGK